MEYRVQRAEMQALLINKRQLLNKEGIMQSLFLVHPNLGKIKVNA
jgi:hypothetical protein